MVEKLLKTLAATLHFGIDWQNFSFAYSCNAVFSKLCSLRSYCMNFVIVGWANPMPNWKPLCQPSTLLLVFWLPFRAFSSWFQRVIENNGLLLSPGRPGLPSQVSSKYSRKHLICGKLSDAEHTWPKPIITSSGGIRANDTQDFIKVLTSICWPYTSFNPRSCTLRQLAWAKWNKQPAKTAGTLIFFWNESKCGLKKFYLWWKLSEITLRKPTSKRFQSQSLSD